IIFVVFLAGIFVGFKKFEGDFFFKINKSIEVYGRVYKEITMNYVDELDPEKFMHSGIDGMLAGLDPYTNFIAEDEGGEVELITSGKYGGIGITIGIRDDKVTITTLMEGYSAQRQGLQPGDRILEVDGKSVSGMKADQIRPLTRGEPGTEVTLTIERDGEKEPLIFVLMREEIQLKNVTFADYIDSGIGYIKLERFARTAGDEVRLALKELKLKGTLNGLILDLRDNPGGLLESATDIVEKFVPKGSLIVTTRGRKKETEKKYSAEEEPMLPDVPLVVLINKNSASASEIVAGALQDLDRAVIIGTRSFGKGLVQTIVPLAFGSQLKMTTAKYYTPSGRCIQEIDYMHKDKAGVFAVTPESLRHKFKTKNGRSVFEAGGVTPDSTVTESEQSAMMKELLRRSAFYRFTNKYISNHRDSMLISDDKLLKEFDSFLDSLKFTFQDEGEKKLSELSEIAVTATYSNFIREEIEQLKKKIELEKENCIQQNSKEILRTARREIMSRFKGEHGRISATLVDDAQAEIAKSFLKNQPAYKTILSLKEDK
ncbi:MAG: S41 family peptidase, partial [Ignavibacteriae bacterium]|nr:S41 family peptidase [Ignavibacteriota bacterium]